MEEWRNVPGYDGVYQVSSVGRIRSKARSKTKPYRMMAVRTISNGYMLIDLSENKVLRRTTIHRLVAEAFIPNPKNKDQVNHIDGNKGNNVIENLEWMTRQENHVHAVHTLKTQAKNRTQKGWYNNNGYIYSRIFINGKWYNLGRFNSTEDAVEAFKKIYSEWWGFLPNIVG